MSISNGLINYFSCLQSESDNGGSDDDDDSDEDPNSSPSAKKEVKTLTTEGDTGKQGFLWREVDTQFSTNLMETHQRVSSCFVMLYIAHSLSFLLFSSLYLLLNALHCLSLTHSHTHTHSILYVSLSLYQHAQYTGMGSIIR